VDNDVIEEFSRAIAHTAKKSGISHNSVLMDVTMGRYEEFTGGRLVINTTEGGGSVTFQVPQQIQPHNLLAAVAAARRYLSEHTGMVTDPTNYIPRRISRLRASFSRASV
jgi:hypothetical protein